LPILSHEHILRLHGAIVSSNLASCRVALLGGINPHFADGLPLCATQTSQILSDLCGMNAIDQLAAGTVPLRIWLANALALAGQRPEADIFNECLHAVGNNPMAHCDALPMRDELADELSRISRSVFLAHDLTRSLYEIEAVLARFPHHVEARMLLERIKRAVEAEARFLAEARARARSGSSFSASGEGAPITVPSWLRVSSIDLVGREKELVELANQAGHVGVLICGHGGMGKTALARALVQRLAPGHPDLQISIDLGGTTAQPPSPFDVMAQIVRAFLPAATLPNRAEELTDLYRGILGGKRTLILLEDAGDRTQVEPLLPPAGSMLVVTSRHRFSLPDVYVLSLDRLRKADAQQLLQRLAPRVNSAAAMKIAEICGRVPLALRLAGGALTHRPDLTPDAYVNRLKVAMGRTDLLGAAFSVNLVLLDPILQILWSRLSLFETCFSSRDAEHISRRFLSIDEALSTFVAYSMLDNEPGTELYSLPRTARRLAKSLMTVTDRATIEAMYLEGMARNLGATSRAAALAEQALALNRECGNQAGEIRVLNSLVNIYESLNDRRRAAEFGEVLLATLRNVGDRNSESAILGKLAVLHERMKDDRRAVTFHEQRFALVRQHGPMDEQAHSAWQLSACYLRVGELGKAIAALGVCADIELETGHDTELRSLERRYATTTHSWGDDLNIRPALLAKYVPIIRYLLFALGGAAVNSARQAPVKGPDQWSRETLEALLAFAPKHDSATYCHLAELCAHSGSTDDALQWLQMGLEHGAAFSRVKRIFDMLRGIPTDFTWRSRTVQYTTRCSVCGHTANAWLAAGDRLTCDSCKTSFQWNAG
jgi:tetratricopeptide (TPR) repeat protein